MTHRGPFQPRTFCDSVKFSLPANEASIVHNGPDSVSRHRCLHKAVGAAQGDGTEQGDVALASHCRQFPIAEVLAKVPVDDPVWF